jgi:transposase InsO family protein
MDSVSGIKVESACISTEEANYTRNQGGKNFGSRNRGNIRGRGYSSGRGFTNYRSDDTWGRNSYGDKVRGSNTSKPVNPNGPDGQPLRCLSCDSIRHLVKQCPHSYENLSKSSVKNAVLFTGNRQQEALILLAEASNSTVLDSACTATVAGEAWMNCYLDSLDPSVREKVLEMPSETKFKFGGGTVLQSKKIVKFPCVIAGTECEIQTDVVSSDIPLLLSKDSMKKAKVKLDLENDCASIFGNDVQLQSTSSGHYCVPINQINVSVEETKLALVASKETELSDVIRKLHKQFAHPSAKRLKSLLQDAGVYTDEHMAYVDKVSENCELCKQYKKTPARPVVSLPLATEFNEVVAVDLKEWKPNVYFLHLIDIATRFSLAAVIRKMTPEVITEKIMKLWIGSGMGPPKKFLADNGGEFANEIFRDMCENVNIEVLNTAAYSPWQNGICERNHAVVDNCVEKILEDQPNLNLEIALLWAVNAKNSLSMVYGWSPYQLVFGANTNLPSGLTNKPPALENTTISRKFAEHLNALHSGRRAFIQAESSERIRRALRHKIRASGECYQHGDRVYYKRDDDNKWKGPGTVIGQDGKVVFVRHGSVYVRVHPCRLIRCGLEGQVEMNQESQNENGKPQQQNEKQYNSLNIDDENMQDLLAEEDDRQQPRNEDIDSQVDQDESQQPNNEDIVPVEPNLPVEERHDIIRQKKRIPNVGDKIEFQLPGDPRWVKAKVLSRGGKATGKNWAYLNVQEENKDSPSGIDFKKDVQNWHLSENTKEVHSVFVPSARHSEDEVLCAMKKELDNWQQFNVFERVPYCGQKLMSTRWVITEKESGDERTVKARLVVRGFEEETPVQSDSPTVHKESLRLFLAAAATLGNDIHSIDIKAAFLQGQVIDRVIYVQPPKECESDTSVVWKLNKCVYGLVDASRNWFLSVKKELQLLHCEESKLDPALFYWHQGDKLDGLFLMHVDDFLWAGSDRFKQDVILPLRMKFHCGKELDCSFRYIGLDIEQTDGQIYLSQKDYTEEIKQVDRDIHPNDVKNNIYPEIVGQLHWIATQSRPDLSFDVLDLATYCDLGDPKLRSKINKVVRKALCNQYKIVFSSLGSIEDFELILYTDASYANLSDRFSSAGGYLIFLKGKNGKLCPIAWSAKKIKRVVKSTLAAEALSLVEGLDACYFVRSMLQEMFRVKDIPIKCFTDNKSLCQNIHSTKLLSEKRLRMDLASIKESVCTGDITVTWVHTSSQIADCLTKTGADFHRLIDILKTGVVL